VRFESVSELINMGGHGPYVWSAYAIALIVIVANVVWPLLRRRRNLEALKRDIEGAGRE